MARNIWTRLPLIGLLLSIPIEAQQRRNQDWPIYLGDKATAHYSPLDQINTSNFSKLEVAWRFKTDHLGPRPEYKLEGTPVAINGILYLSMFDGGFNRGGNGAWVAIGFQLTNIVRDVGEDARRGRIPGRRLTGSPSRSSRRRSPR